METGNNGEAKPTVEVWRYGDAPEEIRTLCKTAEPKDWVFILPADLRGDYLYWLEEPPTCGYCDLERVALPDGREACFLIE